MIQWNRGLKAVKGEAVRIVAVALLCVVLVACEAVQDLVGIGPELSRITVTPESVEVREGESVTLSAVAYDPQGIVADVRVRWRNSHPEVASVNNDGLVTGRITHGETTITARAGRNSVTSNPVTVRVLPPRNFGDIEVTPSSLALRIGESSMLTATTYSVDGSEMDLPVIWRVADSAGITVERDGTVTATRSGGPYAVTAHAGGSRSSAHVTVWDVCPPWSGAELPVPVSSSHQILQVVDLTGSSIPLTTGRPFLFRLLASFGLSEPVNVPSRLRLEMLQDGRTLHTYTSDVRDCLPAESSLDSLYSSYNIVVPPLESEGQLELRAALELLTEDGTVVRSLRYPDTDPITTQVIEPPEFRITLVPIAEQELVPDLRPGDEADVLTVPARWFPINAIDAEIREPVVFDGIFPDGVDGLSEALHLVIEVALAESDDPARYYHGLLDPGVATGGGMGTRGSPYAVTVMAAPRSEMIGEYRTNSQVVAHELGHNFGLPHAPCGPVEGANPDYPYEGGVIGVYGYDHEEHRLVPPDTADFLGYCWPWWISDYSYGHIVEFRNDEALGLDTAASAQDGPVLLVSGRLSDRPGHNGFVLRPAFVLDAVAQPPQAGPWTAELLDASGNVLQRIPFRLDSLSEADLYAFAFTIELSGQVLARLNGLQIVDAAGNVRAVRQADQGAQDALSQQAAQITARRDGAGMVMVSWDSAAISAVLVRDADTGMLLGRGTTGRLKLPFGGSQLEVLVSDGVLTKRVEVRVE